MGGYEVLEHTADVGIRARGTTLEELFHEATLGLLGITGATGEGGEDVVALDLEARDVAGALVDWLDEILYLQDARDAIITDIRVDAVEQGHVRGQVRIAPRDRVLEGTAVKAITYHQLKVVQHEGEWVAEVFFDI